MFIIDKPKAQMIKGEAEKKSAERTQLLLGNKQLKVLQNHLCFINCILVRTFFIFFFNSSILPGFCI